MSTYVLVHGAWHGAWCWARLRPLLEAQGHCVLAPDLPGHGDAPAPVPAMTLDSYATKVTEVIQSADEPVVLVGHSMGGIAATQAAEHVPHRVRRIVYLTAFLPADGQGLRDLVGDVEGPNAVQDYMVVDERAGTCAVEARASRALFYGRCTDEDVAFATSRLVPESLAAIAGRVRVTPARAGRLPRAYIECLDDGAIAHALQRRMQEALPCETVLQLDTDHSPFLSSPAELAERLLSLA